MPELPSCRLLSALIVTAPAGLVNRRPNQEALAPSETVFDPVTVESQSAMSPTPGATSPTHEPERLRSVALFAFVMTVCAVATPAYNAMDPAQICPRLRQWRDDTMREEFRWGIFIEFGRAVGTLEFDRNCVTTPKRVKPSLRAAGTGNVLADHPSNRVTR